MVTRAAGSAGLKETLVSGLNSESRAAPAQEHRDGPCHTSAPGDCEKGSEVISLVVG